MNKQFYVDLLIYTIYLFIHIYNNKNEEEKGISKINERVYGYVLVDLQYTL